MGERQRPRLNPPLDTAGIVLAATFFSLSLTPSLLPRPWTLQGIIAGVLTATGYLVGVFAGALLRPAAARLPARWRAAWNRTGRRRVRRLVATFGCGLGAASLVLGVRAQQDIYVLMGLDPPERLNYLGVPLIAAALFLALLAAARALRIAARALGRLLGRWFPATAAQFAAGLGVGVLAVFLTDGILAEALLKGADRSFAAINTETAPGVTPPVAATLSGSPSSLVSWASLGLEGRAFAADAPTVGELSRFSGRPAVAPIRVYAGLDSAETTRERAALAVRELERTGAFGRRVLCVITTTGTGWVDPQAATALEFMYGGDTALVSMQYSYLPSWLSFLVDRERAMTAGRELFDQVYARWSKLPAGHRPKLLVFGESLGAFGAESAFGGDRDLRERTDGALFVGPPDSSALWRRLVDGRDPGSREALPVYRDGETVRFANHPSDLNLPTSPWNAPRVVYLQHPSDPIVWWTPRLVLTRPDWLEERRGADVLPWMRWYPFVTFWQITADLVFSLDAPPGHGHDYDGEVIAAWARIAPPDGWDDGRTVALTTLLAKRVAGSGAR
ncbi:alpha/beta hydrolase [Microbispora bryophytorum]|uniref:Alpha/beta-hydrolase family protein n=1 Tax=Microbispora bryophytorum subsp. camponoti TaxID=1677852 RepID=A0ABR8KUK4_9ACTN|nr:alpha/beta hydrolase [Microbispora camponoti]MBD3142432.1 alpha/beta-hydrolase family protein [Microbispora camponoti]